MLNVIPVQLIWYAVGLLIAGPVFAVEETSSAGSAVTSAVSGLSAQSMLNRIAGDVPRLMQMVTAIAYVMGIFFIYESLMKFKKFGEQRTMMSSQHRLTEPLAFLFVGAMLLYLPSSVQVGMSSFWADPNPYGYPQEQDQWSQFMSNCYLIVQLFGTIAFIRGLVMLSHVGGHGGSQGGVKKGITHIIGGLFCINIYQFVQVILFTLGIQT